MRLSQFRDLVANMPVLDQDVYFQAVYLDSANRPNERRRKRTAVHFMAHQLTSYCRGEISETLRLSRT